MQASYDAQVVKEISPAYPEWALEQGVSLTVKVLISLDTTGRVTDVRFLNAGQRDFNANIKRAIQSSVFKPLIVAGRAVPVRIVKEYSFEIE
jgi:TonB family protein